MYKKLNLSANQTWIINKLFIEYAYAPIVDIDVCDEDRDVVCEDVSQQKSLELKLSSNLLLLLRHLKLVHANDVSIYILQPYSTKPMIFKI